MMAHGYGFLYGDDENVLKFDIDDIVNTLNLHWIVQIKMRNNKPKPTSLQTLFTPFASFQGINTHRFWFQGAPMESPNVPLGRAQAPAHRRFPGWQSVSSPPWFRETWRGTQLSSKASFWNVFPPFSTCLILLFLSLNFQDMVKRAPEWDPWVQRLFLINLDFNSTFMKCLMVGSEPYTVNSKVCGRSLTHEDTAA